MQVEDFKRWQWAVVGLAVGLLFGCVFRLLNTEHDPDVPALRNPDGLLPLAIVPDFETGRPIADDVVIHPLSSESAKAQLVTFNLRKVYRLSDGTTRTQWEPRKMWTDVPYDDSHRTFADYVASLESGGKLRAANVRFAWWQTPLPGIAIYAVGGVLLIGGLWPTVLNLMIGAGLGVKREAKDDYDLSRFGSGPEEEDAKKKGMSAEDYDELRKMTDELEAASQGEPSEAPAGEQKETPESRKFVAGEADPDRYIAPIPEECREYSGSYYPVARSKKHENE